MGPTQSSYGVKRPNPEAGYLPPPNTLVTNDWSQTSVRPTCLHAAYRDNVTVYHKAIVNCWGRDWRRHVVACGPVNFGRICKTVRANVNSPGICPDQLRVSQDCCLLRHWPHVLRTGEILGVNSATSLSWFSSALPEVEGQYLKLHRDRLLQGLSLLFISRIIYSVFLAVLIASAVLNQ